MSSLVFRVGIVGWDVMGWDREDLLMVRPCTRCWLHASFTPVPFSLGDEDRCMGKLNFLQSLKMPTQ